MSNSKANAFVSALALLGACLVSVAPSRGAEAPAAPPSPRAVAQSVINQALAILRDPKLTADDKRQKVKQIAYDHMNFEVMARMSLGSYWRDLTDAKRSEYAETFKQYVTNTYRHTTDHYTDEDVKITGDRQEQDKDWTVQTQIIGSTNDKPGQLVAKVDYRLRLQNNQWKVIDLTIDGVSLVQNFRSQFREIMANGGIDKLLQLLREKNAANDK